MVWLFIKTPKKIFSYGVSQCNKNSAFTMSFNVSEEKGWVSQYKKIWNETESQLFEKWQQNQQKEKVGTLIVS